MKAQGMIGPLDTLFTDLDPLGTGKSKPYTDKKNFFPTVKSSPMQASTALSRDSLTHNPQVSMNENITAASSFSSMNQVAAQSMAHTMAPTATQAMAQTIASTAAPANQSMAGLDLL